MTACSVCKRPDGPYFKVVRGDGKGGENVLTEVCSLPCLMKFTSNYAMLQGVRLVYGAKSAWQQIKDVLAGR